VDEIDGEVKRGLKAAYDRDRGEITRIDIFWHSGYPAG
jgi:hypothetical protein